MTDYKMKERKICFFDRGSIHYRKAIWVLMDRELPCDFYFGDFRKGNIKPLDTNLLSNFKGYFHNVYIGPFWWQKGALKLFGKGYTDIIMQGETPSLTMWTMLILNKLFYKRNIYLWSHGAYGKEGGFRKRIVVWNKKLATGCFLYGDHARQLLIQWGAPAEKLHLIYNSLNYDEQLLVRHSIQASDFYKQHFGNENKNLVFIGRLTPVKKLDQVLQALALLRSQGLNCNMTFVGDGDVKPKLQELAQNLGLGETTWFYGACYDEEKIAELLHNADLCVSPGNVGLTAMHAMTFGCPVVSNDNFSTQMPEYEAIEDGATGTFFHENDIESFADAIKRWLGNCTDRDIVRQACYHVIDTKYNPHVQIETLKRVIYNE